MMDLNNHLKKKILKKINNYEYLNKKLKSLKQYWFIILKKSYFLNNLIKISNIIMKL